MTLNFDTIFESLDYVGDSAIVECPKDFIVRTILRLPEDVAERAIYELTYFNMGDKYGLYHEWSPSIFHKDPPYHFVLLNLQDVALEWEKEYTIAHEIAHFVLGHGFISDEKRNIELEADNLVEFWGFQIPQRRREM